MQRAGSAALVAGALALVVAVVAAALGMASHHFADVKTWLAVAGVALVVGIALVLFGLRRRA